MLLKEHSELEFMSEGFLRRYIQLAATLFLVVSSNAQKSEVGPLSKNDPWNVYVDFSLFEKPVIQNTNTDISGLSRRGSFWFPGISLTKKLTKQSEIILSYTPSHSFDLTSNWGLNWDQLDGELALAFSTPHVFSLGINYSPIVDKNLFLGLGFYVLSSVKYSGELHGEELKIGNSIYKGDISFKWLVRGNLDPYFSFGYSFGDFDDVLLIVQIPIVHDSVSDSVYFYLNEDFKNPLDKNIAHQRVEDEQYYFPLFFKLLISTKILSRLR